MTGVYALVQTGVAAVSVLAAPGTFPAGLVAGERVDAVPQRSSSLAVRAADGWYAFETPARVVEREDIAPDSLTMATLSNGVRLVLKPSDAVADEVLVRVLIDGGLQSLAPEAGVLAAAEIAETMFVSGGVGLATHEQLVARFGSVASAIEFSSYTPAFALDARIGPKQLRPLLEILTAYVGDPGWRFEDLEGVKEREIQGAQNLISNPAIALQTHSPGLLASGDARWLRPTEAQTMAVGADQIRRAIETPFTSGEIEITMVGDFDLESTIAMAASTFGTLPARPGVAPQRAPVFPAHSTTPMQIRFHGLSEEQGRLVAWPAATDLPRPEKEAVAAMLGVMVFRLRALPAYQAAGFARGYKSANGYLQISTFGRPDALANFNADVARIARQIAAHGVTREEIDQAQAPGVADSALVLANAPNRYWFALAINLKGDRSTWERARSFADRDGVTPVDVQYAAARYLIEDRSVLIVALPEPPPQDRQRSDAP